MQDYTENRWKLDEARETMKESFEDKEKKPKTARVRNTARQLKNLRREVQTLRRELND